MEDSPFWFDTAAPVASAATDGLDGAAVTSASGCSLSDQSAALVAPAAAADVATETSEELGPAKRLVVPVQGEPVSFFNRDFMLVILTGCFFF